MAIMRQPLAPLRGKMPAGQKGVDIYGRYFRRDNSTQANRG